MDGAQNDHKRHHFEECEEYVGGGQGQAEHTQTGGDGPLEDGQPQSEQRVSHTPVDRHVPVLHKVVRDVSRKVHWNR